MVRFDDQGVAAAQGVPDLRGGAAQVGGDPEAKARRRIRYRDGHGVGCVVDGDEGFDFEVSDREPVACSVDLDRLLPPQQAVAGVSGSGGHVERSAVRPGEDTGASGVIAVFVGNDDRGDPIGCDADIAQPSCQLTAAEAGVDQEMGRSRAHQGGIAPAAAAQDREAHVSAAGGRSPLMR